MFYSAAELRMCSTHKWNPAKIYLHFRSSTVKTGISKHVIWEKKKKKHTPVMVEYVKRISFVMKDSFGPCHNKYGSHWWYEVCVAFKCKWYPLREQKHHKNVFQWNRWKHLCEIKSPFKNGHSISGFSICWLLREDKGYTALLLHSKSCPITHTSPSPSLSRRRSLKLSQCWNADGPRPRTCILCINSIFN